MALYKIDEFYPNYREQLFDGDDIKGLDVYAGRTGEKIGTIDNALVDEEGRFRYFVIDTGFWIFGKKVLLPVGYCQIDDHARRIYATHILNKKQVEELPEYNESTRVNRHYEERVRKIYRTSTTEASVNPVTEAVAPLEVSAPLNAAYSASRSGAISAETSNATYDHATYNYQQDPSVYDLNARDHQTLKLYEERLTANKKRRQTGEVVVAKHVETEKARVSLPLEKERVVIERTTPADAGRIVSPRNIDFREGEVARMKVYEETADIHKEAFVREEVRIRKEVERETVEAEETLRREELDIDTEGRRVVDRRFDKRS
jgi:uncharacterized protein (TIGR02271 family)